MRATTAERKAAYWSGALVNSATAGTGSTNRSWKVSKILFLVKQQNNSNILSTRACTVSICYTTWLFSRPAPSSGRSLYNIIYYVYVYLYKKKIRLPQNTTNGSDGKTTRWATGHRWKWLLSSTSSGISPRCTCTRTTTSTKASRWVDFQTHIRTHRIVDELLFFFFANVFRFIFLYHDTLDVALNVLDNQQWAGDLDHCTFDKSFCSDILYSVWNHAPTYTCFANSMFNINRLFNAFLMFYV